MTDPTSIPFQDDDGRRDPSSGDDPVHEGQLPERATTDGAGAGSSGAGTGPGGSGAVDPDLLPPAQTQTDLLAARVDGPEDHEGMTELWRATMDLPHWWFIAVGEEGMESPAAAEIDGQLMLLTFTNGERARHFAVQNGMIQADDDLRAIALPPAEVVSSSESYVSAEIAGLMFDPHLTGYFIASDQLPVVWDAIRGTDDQGTQG